MIGAYTGEIPLVIGDAGVLVPEDDVSALAGALRDLADDPSLRVELGNRGRARVLERFTHDRVAAATVAVYRSLAHG